MRTKLFKKQISVLITSSGTKSTTSVIDCLRNNYENRKIKIICSDQFEQPIMHHKADKFYLLPAGNSRNYIKSLIRICKKEKIDVILPCSGSEVLALAKNIELLKSKGIYPAVSNFNSVKKTMNKISVYNLFRKHKMPVPDFYLVRNKKEFLKAIKALGYPKVPVCFKPSKYTSSGGDRGFRILRKTNSLSEIILKQRPISREIDYETAIRLCETTKDLELIVMEYLPGDMKVVYTFADAGKMIHCIHLLIQKRDESGHAFEAIIKKNEQLTSICKNFIKIMKYDFNNNFQFQVSRNGIPKLLEINPRIAGTISLPMAAGVNLPYITVKQALGEKLPKNKTIIGTHMIRYWKEFYESKLKNFEFS